MSRYNAPNVGRFIRQIKHPCRSIKRVGLQRTFTWT